MDKVAYLRGVLEDARCRGDRGVERAVSADLARLGHPMVSEPAAAPVAAAMETTAVEQPEQAVPAPKRRRRAPAKPKDE